MVYLTKPTKTQEKRYERMNRKGNTLTEVFTLSIVLFAFVILFVVIYLAVDKINTNFQANPIFDDANESKEIMGDMKNNAPLVFDGIIVTLLFGLIMVAVVGAFLIDTHPMFFIFSVILLAVYLIIGGYMNEAWDDVNANSEFSTYSADFPLSTFIFDNIIIIILITGFLIMGSLYAKLRNS